MVYLELFLYFFSYMYGEEGYCLTSFQTAINYLISEGMKAAISENSWIRDNVPNLLHMCINTHILCADSKDSGHVAHIYVF